MKKILIDRTNIILAIFGLGLWVVTSYVEAPAVAWLMQHPAIEFRTIMNQSIFEDGRLGVNDSGVLVGIFCFLLWIYQRQGKILLKKISQKDLFFVWSTGALTAIFIVHSFKWIISRARPYVIFNEEFFANNGLEVLQSLTLPGYMPLDGTRGPPFNSFPSGHTASIAALLSLCYLMKRNKTLFYSSFGVVLICSIAMAVARSMAGMHWLSDSVFSFFATWVLIRRVYLNQYSHIAHTHI